MNEEEGGGGRDYKMRRRKIERIRRKIRRMRRKEGEGEEKEK